MSTFVVYTAYNRKETNNTRCVEAKSNILSHILSKSKLLDKKNDKTFIECQSIDDQQTVANLYGINSGDWKLDERKYDVNKS